MPKNRSMRRSLIWGIVIAIALVIIVPLIWVTIKAAFWIVLLGLVIGGLLYLWNWIKAPQKGKSSSVNR